MTLSETMTSAFYTTGGIFSEIASLNVFTWLTSNNKLFYDYEYYLKRSGDKTISPLFSKLMTNKTLTYLNNLARVIINLYSDKWNKLYVSLISTSYDSINNKHIESTDINSTNDTFTPNTTKSDTTNESYKLTTSTANDDNNSVYGFNSPTAVPTDSGTSNETTTESKNANDNVITSSSHLTGTEGRVISENKSNVTSGYEGNDVQDRLDKEVRLRNEYNFYDIIMEDVDKVLVTRYYNKEVI